MIGATIEIGENLLEAVKVAGPILLAGIAAWQARKSRQTAQEGTDAAKHASSQLVNNGGTTALDKIERGQAEVLARIEDIAAIVDTHATQLARLQVPPQQ